MISKKQLTEASFWEISRICLDCGTPADFDPEAPECEECGSVYLVNPDLAIAVLEKVEESLDDRG